ncbi:class I adenylate-forming enzyme family protein [Methylobacterium sp. Leaf118]|uniref:class I adenylate-forming enzyme family protein n=1 Tax=Methylobacterium sp. Leaf118 TaxID=2876562 RepID=UPI001E32C6BC|nr:class I adenylate-forming enzyme family protein [Methylobacterium sp. Leaf118]
MSAHQAITQEQASRETPTDVPLRRVGLGSLLAATARCHPDRIAVIDPADKPVWSGRPAITWTYAAAAEIVGRLARGLRGWRLAPGSRVGICLPGSAESVLAILAVEAAGHVAVPLPVSWDEERLLAAAQGATLSAVLTQARLGSAAPAERLCSVAARYFGLRYLAAFGPDVPDGVINLDRFVLDGPTEPGHGAAPSPAGLVTFAGGDPDRPVFRNGESLVAAAAAHLVAVRAEPGERILSLVGPHDLRGLATGLATALVAGATLEVMPLFDGATFAAALARPIPTHLVAPAFLEKNLAGRDLPPDLRTATFLHRAPARFPGRSRVPGHPQSVRVDTVIDAVAFDETAILSGRRGGPGDVALVLGKPERLALPANLMALRRDPDGRLAFRGQACAATALQRGAPRDAAAETWRETPYAASLFAGLATAIEMAPPRVDQPVPSETIFAPA